MCLLGHSIEAVDWPYYRRLLAIPAMDSARWWVACIEQEDWEGKTSRLEELGVASKNIVTCSWSELLRTPRMLLQASGISCVFTCELYAKALGV